MDQDLDGQCRLGPAGCQLSAGDHARKHQDRRNQEVTTDPGRALITGLWKDVGRVKGPILRGLAARAPYFHNGSANSLRDVVEFYDQRFHIGFTDREKQDLVAFLSAL